MAPRKPRPALGPSPSGIPPHVTPPSRTVSNRPAGSAHPPPHRRPGQPVPGGRQKASGKPWSTSAKSGRRGR